MVKKIKKLYRAKEKDSMIGGVCAGIADYANIDPTIVRLLWTFLTMLTVGFGILAYLICWIIIPRKSSKRK